MQKIVAICYDFDKTLTPNNMQEQGLIELLGYKNSIDFWAEVDSFAEENLVESNLAYMYFIQKRCKMLNINKATLKSLGSKIRLYEGLESWFDSLNEYAQRNGVILEHYILSSGLSEIIEGTKIGNKFNGIYASGYVYDELGIPVWPKQVINYTNKTQFLFRISKGIESPISDSVNDVVEGKMRVPFLNMIYIGDSETDIPCMKIIQSHQGVAVGVYDENKGVNKKAEKSFLTRSIKYVPANYKEGSILYNIVLEAIDNAK